MYFVGRKELQTVFGLTDEQIFECLSLLNVNKEVTRVGSIDFWGALALASSGSSEDKISFCFRLMDSNKDDHLSLNELVIVLICITRGLSKLKGLELIPEELIDRIVNSAFISERKKLRSDGEISSNAFVSFALANETCRQYLAAIGAKVPPVDAAALVLKRTLALKELAQVRFKIQETLFKLEDVQLREMVMLSRGGDLPYLKLTEAASVLSDKPQDVESSVSPNKSKRPPKPPGNTTSALPMGSPQRKLPTSMPASTVSHSPDASTIASSVDHDRRVEDDYLMYAQLHDSDTVPSLATFGNSAEEELILSLSKDHPVKKYIIEEDTWKNEIYRLRPLNIPPPMAQSDQSSANYSYELSTRICSSQFASDLLKQWLKLPHDEDKLVALDEATLVALFFQVGVHLSYRAAQDCLHEVIPSQLSRYSFDDIMQWFRYSFDLTDHTERARHNAFYGFLGKNSRDSSY